MTNKSRIAIGYDQMPFTFLHGNSRRERRSPRASRVHDSGSRKTRSVYELCFPFADARNRCGRKQFCSLVLRPINEKSRCTRRIKHGIVGNEKPTSHSLAQVWFQTLEVTGIENFK